MKVYVLNKLINGGTSDYEFEIVSVCSSLDKCKEEALKEMRYPYNNVNVDDLVIGEIIEKSSEDFEFTITENNKYNTKFKFEIWKTEVITEDQERMLKLLEYTKQAIDYWFEGCGDSPEECIKENAHFKEEVKYFIEKLKNRE